MISFPNGKINLGLYITNRRSDGYHDLETVFYPVTSLHDALEIAPAKGTETALHVDGKTIAGDTGQNLVWKAYELMKQRFPAKVPALDIYLLKNIPMGAGLGGGSADGAFMLKLLNDFLPAGVDRQCTGRHGLDPWQRLSVLYLQHATISQRQGRTIIILTATGFVCI